MLPHMRAHAIAGPWAAGERLLVVRGGEDPRAAELVRYTKRLADRLRALDGAPCRDAPPPALGEAERDRVADTLRLAERLGGETLILPGERIAEEIIAWARGNNVTQIVIGKPSAARAGAMAPGLRAARPDPAADDIVVLVIAGGRRDDPPKRVARAAPRRSPRCPISLPRPWSPPPPRVGWLLQSLLDRERRPRLPHGRGRHRGPLRPGRRSLAAVAACSLQLLLPPPSTPSRSPIPTNVAALFFFLVVAVVTSNLAARARPLQAVAATAAETTEALYAFSRKLAGVVTLDDLLWATAIRSR